MISLTSITATYSGGDAIVGTAVTDLTGIVVTAYYSDGSTETVTGYTLSGTIGEGNNTITVSYGGKTTTFAVVGVAEPEQPVGTEVDFSNLTKEAISVHGDGTTKKYTNWYTFEAVDCKDYQTIWYSNVSAYDNNSNVYIVGLAFYDAENKFVSGIGTNESEKKTFIKTNDTTGKNYDYVISGTCAVPENAFTVRIAFNNNEAFAEYATEVILCK